MHVSFDPKTYTSIELIPKAVTEMVRQLRKGKGRNGLILANGGVVSYQHVICLSSQPRQDGSTYPLENSLPDTITDIPVPAFTLKAGGEGVIEVSLAACPVSGWLR